ncbi:MAG: aminopeptidase [Acidimicrobiia bacterium]|nr:MAG: aminopeptidase [Acidimicrobiia bacterium]
MIRRVLVAAAVVACTGPATVPPTPPPTTATPPPTTSPAVHGSLGLGDPILSGLGNGGYDAVRYHIRLDLDSDLVPIRARTTVEGTALQRLASLSLDLGEVSVTGVEGDPPVVGFDHRGGELMVSFADPVEEGTTFRLDVSYVGPFRPAEQTAAPYRAGWQQGPDSVYVFSEPDGGPTWFPGNHHPSDPAVYRLEVTVPDPWTVVSAGPATTSGDTWTFEVPRGPTYAVPLAVGDFTGWERSVDGRRYRVSVDRDLADSGALTMFDLQPEITAFFEGMFGPYPYREVGALVVEDTLPGALETIEVATYVEPSLSLGHRVVAHEIAHQWFGNRVTLARWDDMWLNEGLATYAEWLWVGHHEGEDAMRQVLAAAYDRIRAADLPPPDHPPADRLFNPSVYLRGGLALAAVEARVGRDSTVEALRRWAERSEPGTTDDFLEVVGEVGGATAAATLRRWISDATLPPPPN